MKNTIKVEEMIAYLQAQVNRFEEEEKKYGANDRGVLHLFDEMIGCKEMVEALIEAPVNLRKDGTVTIGF